MAASALDELAFRFRSGEIGSDEFFRQTAPVWRRLARYLLRRWRAPAWVEPEELEQELKLGAWRAVWEYNEHRSKSGSIARFVEWHAVDNAKKRLHKMRGACLHGSADRNLSRYEVSFSELGEVREEQLLAGASEEATQEAHVERGERVRRVLEVCEASERRALERFLRTMDLQGVGSGAVRALTHKAEALV